MRDRVPAKPGRMLLKRENGTQEYVTLTRADEPTQEGTPLNAASLFSAQTAAKYPGGIETVNDALGVLGAAPVYEEISAPIYLSSLADGETFQMKENGVSVNFVKLTSNYENSGRIAVIRSDAVNANIAWSATGTGTYAGSELDTYMQETYLQMLENKDQIQNVPVRVYTSTNNSGNVATISRKVFAPSMVEAGSGSSDGSKISSFPRASNQEYWTRTPNGNTTAYYIETNGSSTSVNKVGVRFPRPMFTLPNNYIVDTPITTSLKTILGEEVKWGVKIETGSYVGTGTSGLANPNTLTFDFEPKLVFVQQKGYYPGSCFIRECTVAQPFYTDNTSQDYGQSVSWSGATLNWYCLRSTTSMRDHYQGNTSGETYFYIAIG